MQRTRGCKKDHYEKKRVDYRYVVLREHRMQRDHIYPSIYIVSGSDVSLAQSFGSFRLNRQ
jgi:hypothetical protein